jgi:hypothetical protein
MAFQNRQYLHPMQKIPTQESVNPVYDIIGGVRDQTDVFDPQSARIDDRFGERDFPCQMRECHVTDILVQLLV